MITKREQLRQWVAQSQRIVFFGGAGVSTESGIPDFRSTDGLYSQSYAYPPETILSHSFFKRNPQEFFRFYQQKILHLDAKPNPAHLKLAQWEREGKLLGVITQNIDGLHQAAGSVNVWELHGSLHRNFCQRCRKVYDAQEMSQAMEDALPICSCGGIIKPDVVLYEEGLNETTLEEAVMAISQADMLIIGGTSLNVYPAAGLVRYFRGERLVLINKGEVGQALSDALVITDPIGEVLGALD